MGHTRLPGLKNKILFSLIPCILMLGFIFSQTSADFHPLSIKNQQGAISVRNELTAVHFDSDDPASIQKSIWLTIDGCTFDSSDKYTCTGSPQITFTAEDNSVGRIVGSLGTSTFNCQSSSCSFLLNPTGPDGQLITFQGISPQGARTEEYSAVVRVTKNDAANSFTVEALSSQLKGQNSVSCADIWETFPDQAQSQQWLTTPSVATDLHSSESLYYLAAALINNGLVDASSCPNNGLMDTETASECGVSAANDKMLEWQNQFDSVILSVAVTDSVPAHLLKNVFLRESQFWPGTYYDPLEVGLGQMTENGADTLLLWNRDFFNSFCLMAFDQYTCSGGYTALNAYEKQLLKGYLVTMTNASCPECQNGIDTVKANYSIHVFAQTLVANCRQVDQIIHNTTDNTSRQVSSYTDLWKFTLANYNAGPGCLTKAISETEEKDQAINWENVSSNFEPVCQAAIEYIDDITKDRSPQSGNGTDLAAETTVPTETAAAAETPTSTPAPSSTPADPAASTPPAGAVTSTLVSSPER